jgi:hypothetical protein
MVALFAIGPASEDSGGYEHSNFAFHQKICLAARTKLEYSSGGSSPGGRQGDPVPALSERDMRVLAFERGTWRTPGAKEQAIAEVLGVTATRYYQLLNELIDSPEALKFDPVLVKRLRAQRARRQRIRSPHPGTK